MSKPLVEKVDGVRRVNRTDLYRYETPLYKVATENSDVIVYYAEDDIPAFLTAPAPQGD